jgi:hypothetical protein
MLYLSSKIRRDFALSAVAAIRDAGDKLVVMAGVTPGDNAVFDRLLYAE